ncbi:MAG: hypothetical protein ACT4TC_25570 [Myxococcaceae bacterium]
MNLRVLLVLSLTLLACREEPRAPTKPAAPTPLPRGEAVTAAKDDREALHRVEQSPLWGHAVPKEGTVLKLKPDDYLAAFAELLATADDAGEKVWLQHPSAALAYPLVLRDEKAFGEWIDEAKPGKIRIIQRADGFELQTNLGKMPGADRNGPTVPARGGKQDLATLRRDLLALKGRFKVAPDACLVPSFGTEALAITNALSSMSAAEGEPIFDELCLVYPRPTSPQ